MKQKNLCVLKTKLWMIAELETNWPLFFVNWLWSLVGTRPIWTNVGAWRGLPVAGNEAQPDGKGPGREQDRAQTRMVLAEGSAEVLDDGRPVRAVREWSDGAWGLEDATRDTRRGSERGDLRGRAEPEWRLEAQRQTQGWGWSGWPFSCGWSTLIRNTGTPLSNLKLC